MHPAPSPPKADDGVSPKRETRTAATSVVGSILWATLPIVLIVQLAASFAIESANVLSSDAQLAARIRRIAETRGPLLAEPLWKMRYDQVIETVKDIIQDDAIASVVVRDDTAAPIASQQRERGAAPTATIVHPITYRNGNIDVAAGSISIAYAGSFYWNLWQALHRPLLVGLLATLAMHFALKLAAGVFVGHPLAVMLSTIRRSKQDNRYYPAEISATNEFGQLAQSFNTLQQMTAQAFLKLEHLASHDPLTGLPNRRALSDRLKVPDNPTPALGKQVALHFVDLDDFKVINDTFGHDSGDRFLVHVARQLQDAVGPHDWVARLGGDEFIVLQSMPENEAGAHALARRLLEAISRPLRIHGKSIVPRASIGIALRREGDPEVAQLPALADVALYHAKSQGSGSIAILDEALQLTYARSRELELALPTAFAEGQFEVWFQSQVDFATNQIVCLEALIRWRHPQHGIVGPDEFLPLIEHSGNAPRLAAFVVDSACVALKRLAAAGRPDIRVAINLSATELTEPRFADKLQAICNLHAVPLSSLELEITEGSLINNMSGALDALSGLRALGATIALDDFGTGYSSLAYLRRFPLDKIKIDKAFLREIPGNAEDMAIVDVIAALAKKLRLTVVAEGVERIEQARAMSEIGVCIGQGYMYHRPAPIEETLAFVALERDRSHASVRVVAG